MKRLKLCEIIFKVVIYIEEIWKDIIIDGYDVRYQISNLGNVKSIARFSKQGHWLEEVILKQYDNTKGYKYVDLYSNRVNNKSFKIRKYVHRLVAEYFVDNPNGYTEVDHIDTNPSNNIYTNLRWCTHIGNYENELTRKKQIESHANWTISEEQKEKMRLKIAVLKNNEIIYIFNSYKDLDINSKKIIGKQLWNVYVRQVINGQREEYNGYTFKLA